ncbi:MAG TPA: glycosyltransferase family 87 protein, partial [Anaerolineales bacterium]|nr:glycosyltransferase family 87 protein [Anaerolineales bacterium]
MDFGSFIAASRENAQGNDPYTTRSPLVFQIRSQRTGQALLSPNLNPPLSLFLFSPLASLNPLRAANGWRMTSAALYAACILLLALAYPRAASIPRLIWAVSLAGFWHTLAVGQIYILLLIPILAVWILTERGYLVLAGIALGGIVALRPNFLFWLALLALSGDRVIVRSALISGLALSLLPIAVYGPSVYGQWLSALTAYPGVGLLIAGNSSLASLMARAGSPLPNLLLAVPFAIIMLFILTRTRKNKPLEYIHMLGLVGSLL